MCTMEAVDDGAIAGLVLSTGQTSNEIQTSDFALAYLATELVEGKISNFLSLFAFQRKWKK